MIFGDRCPQMGVVVKLPPNGCGREADHPTRRERFSELETLRNRIFVSKWPITETRELKIFPWANLFVTRCEDLSLVFSLQTRSLENKTPGSHISLAEFALKFYMHVNILHWKTPEMFPTTYRFCYSNDPKGTRFVKECAERVSYQASCVPPINSLRIEEVLSTLHTWEATLRALDFART